MAAADLYERHSSKILGYCLHQLGSREEAEDAVQTTFMNAFRALGRGVVPESEVAWLFKIAENVCLSRRRSSWRRGRIESPSDFDVIEEIVPGPSRQRDELIGIEDALASMPEQQRRAILLREWQGLSYREVADELGVSQSAVETLIFRARRSLAQGLEEPERARRPKRKSLRRALHIVDAGALLAAAKTLLAGSAAVKATAAAVAVTAAAGTAASVKNEGHSPSPAAPAPALVAETPVPEPRTPAAVSAASVPEPARRPPAPASAAVAGRDETRSAPVPSSVRQALPAAAVARVRPTSAIPAAPPAPAAVPSPPAPAAPAPAAPAPAAPAPAAPAPSEPAPAAAAPPAAPVPHVPAPAAAAPAPAPVPPPAHPAPVQPEPVVREGQTVHVQPVAPKLSITLPVVPAAELPTLPPAPVEHVTPVVETTHAPAPQPSSVGTHAEPTLATWWRSVLRTH